VAVELPRRRRRPGVRRPAPSRGTKNRLGPSSPPPLSFFFWGVRGSEIRPPTLRRSAPRWRSFGARASTSS
jgi:hypothetical protein